MVVAGQCRKAGKTTTVCDIIAATKDLHWMAIKLTPLDHAPGSSADPDTDRYTRAGAAESHLLRSLPDPLPAGRNLIIESNSVLESLTPDVTVFVASSDRSAEWKPSARSAANRADYTITARPTHEQLASLAARFDSLR